MDVSIIQSPGLIFTATTILIALTLNVLKESWGFLRSRVEDIEQEKRNEIFGYNPMVKTLRHSPERESGQYILRIMAWGLVFLILSIALSTFSLMVIALPFIGVSGDSIGPWGPIFLFGGLFFFCLGIFPVGYGRIIFGIAFLTGKEENLEIEDSTSA